MSIRTIILNHIKGDAPLLSLIPAENIWSSGSLKDDNAPPRPFIVIRYGPTAVGVGSVKRGSVTFWVHDDLGDYSKINQVLERLYARLDQQVSLQDGSGNEVIQISWDNVSGDLSDPGFRTITRNTTFNFVGKGV